MHNLQHQKKKIRIRNVIANYKKNFFRRIITKQNDFDYYLWNFENANISIKKICAVFVRK